MKKKDTDLSTIKDKDETWEDTLERLKRKDEIVKDTGFREELTTSKAVGEIINHLAKHPIEKVQFQFSFLPTPLTRTTPFHIMSAREKATRQDVIEFHHQTIQKPNHITTWKIEKEETFIIEGSWGKIITKGPKLSTTPDEDILYAILAILRQTRKDQQPCTINTSMYKLCKILNKTPGGRAYKSIIESIERLRKTDLTLDVNELPKRGKQGKPRFLMRGTMLSGYIWDRKTGKLTITVNEYFYESFGKNATYSNLSMRYQLKGDIAKALMRFYDSHTKSLPMHMTTVGDAINLIGLEPYRLKARLKKAHKELIEIRYLEKGWIDKKGLIHIKKAKSLIPKPD